MRTNGKKTIYVNSNLFVENINFSSFESTQLISPISDSIRYFSSNFWTFEKNKLKKANAPALFNITYPSDNIVLLEANKEKFTDDFFDNGILKTEFDKEGWESFIDQLKPDPTQVLEDFYITFPEPINLAENFENLEKNANYINKEFKYSFFSPQYENLTSQNFFNVNTLPTIYNLLNDQKIEGRTEEQNLFLGLGGFIKDNYVSSIIQATKITNELKEYFNIYSETYTNEEVADVLREIRLINSEFKFLSREQTSLLKKINNNFVPFPFYCEINFSNISENNSFLEILEKYTLDEDLLDTLATQTQLNEQKINFIFQNQYSDKGELALSALDLKKWFNFNLNLNRPVDAELGPIEIFNYTSVLEYIKDNLKAKTRKPSEFLQDSYKDILFYKIEKRQFNHTSQPINSTYLLPDKSSVIKFIDTQIKYGTEYFYTISAYTLVVGTQYSYNDYYNETNEAEKLRDIKNGLYKLKIDYKPSYKIIKIPMAQFSGAVFSNPYTKPVLNFIQKNDKISFNLLNSDLTSFEEFEIIEDKDFQTFEKIRISQDNENEKTIFSINNTSSDIKLQIYRTTDYPTNFLSFQGKLYKTLLLTDNNKNFIDTLVPNINYYYTFRFLNDHDVPSNVSDIYQIKLIDENGYYYLETSKIDLRKQTPRKSYKGMKRYLLVRPSVIQTQPKYDSEVMGVEDVQLGPLKDEVWGKNFILTIRSTKSNRILKFNFITKIEKK